MRASRAAPAAFCIASPVTFVCARASMKSRLSPAAVATACRVSLNTDRLILEVTDSPSRGTVAMSFRTRRGRSDLSGGGDNSVSAEQLGTHEGYESLISALRLANGLDSERR